MSLVKIVYWSVKVPEKSGVAIPCTISPSFSLELPLSGATTWNFDVGFFLAKRNPTVEIYLQSKSSIKEAVGCKFELVERKNKNGKSITEPEIHMMDIEVRGDWTAGWGVKGMITQKRLLASRDVFCPNGEILIKADIYVLSNGWNPPNYAIEHLNTQQNQQQISQASSVSDEFFDRFVDRQEDQVVTLKTSNGQDLSADKKVLSENSEIFKNMFNRGVVIVNRSRGDVIAETAEFSYITIKELLRFMYMKKIDIERYPINIALDLFKAAHRYKVNGLPETCLVQIGNSLNKTNVLKILVFAESNEMPDLFQKCCEVIKKFYLEVEEQREWNQLKIDLRRKIHRFIIGNCA